MERGPIVYCAEGADNGGAAFELHIPLDAAFEDGAVNIGGCSFPSLKSSNGVTLVPYCIWGNRQPGNEMQTWFPTDMWAGSDKRLTVSHCFSGDGTDSLFSGIKPASSNDQTIRRFTFWPHRGTKEWVQCDFRNPCKLNGIKIYWFDDTQAGGGCALPKSCIVKWRMSNNDAWQTIGVQCPVAKDGFCDVKFPSEIEVASIRLDISLRKGLSAGILALEKR